MNNNLKPKQTHLTGEQELRQMVDAIPGLLVVTSPSGEVEYINEPLRRITGRSLDSLQNLGWTSMVHPDDVPSLQEQWADAVKTGTKMNPEYRQLCADGLYRWWQICIEPFRNEEGIITRWYGVITDIDERKKAEQALRESEQQLRQMVDAIPVMLIINSPTGEVEYVNKPLVDTFGRNLESLRNGGWLSLIHPDDAKGLLDQLEDLYSSGGNLLTEYRMLCVKGKYRWIQCRKQALKDETGTIVCWYGVLTDIDDRKRAEEAFRSSQEKLARAMQIATVAETSASIAHEINQPLGAVVANGFACQGWLASDPPNIERAQKVLDRIIRDGKAASEVVQKIRELFRHNAPTKISLDIKEIITEVQHLLFAELQQKRVILHLDLEEHLPSVPADRVQMQQVFVNLLRNAIDSMEAENDRPNRIIIRAANEKANIIVEVIDNGGGLRDGEKVFEPFFTTKESGEGIGLAICRSIIEAHEGRIWAANNETGGAVFAFTLPVQPPGDFL
ncbi:MAG TPA: PAS domain-containing protein [Pyrinomonadaceae bacterium]